MTTSGDTQYWATLDADNLAKRTMDKVRAYRRWYHQSGFAAKALKGWRYANGRTDAGEDSSRLQTGGERAALVKMVLNGVRPLRQRTVAMVLAGQPETQTIASNSDAASREQADLGRGVLEHVHRVKHREKRDRETLNAAMDMGMGFLAVEWDSTQGKDVAADPGEQMEGMPPPSPTIVKAGDFRYTNCTPFDVYWDPGVRDAESRGWVVWRGWENRWRLAAQYPERAERILAVSTIDRLDIYSVELDVRLDDVFVETDMIPVYTLWHLPGPELPDGLEFKVLDNGTYLGPPGPYPYEPDALNIVELLPDKVTGLAQGYTAMWDALGIADMINAIASAGATNITTGAVPPIIDFANSGLQVGAPVGTGNVVLRVARPEFMPQYMQPPQTPPEAYKLMEVLERRALESMGLNETSMGRPPFSGMAAQAMALLDAKADEYQDPLRKGYLSYLEQVATIELRTLKRYAKTERIANVVGKAKQWMTKAFTAEDLSALDGVHMEPVSMASRSQAGRLGILEMLKAFEVPLTPEQIIGFLQTGEYESDFEAPMANRLRLREENEGLMEGRMPPIVIGRPYWQDIPEHLALLSSPVVNERPDIVQAVMNTISAKYQAWLSTPPPLLALMGAPPPPQMAMGLPGAGAEAMPVDGAQPDAASAALTTQPPADPNLPQPPPVPGA